MKTNINWDNQLRLKFDNQLVQIVTFHASYSYEDFVEGITVELNDGANADGSTLNYKLKEGIFKSLCKKALAACLGVNLSESDEYQWLGIYEKYLMTESIDFSKAPKYVLIIDEINRGDMSKILGELVTLLEEDKRIGAENEMIVKLPVSGDNFGVPPNILIIGTMNTADRSIALLDIAIRRRFGFIEIAPNFENFESEYLQNNKKTFEKAEIYDLLKKSSSAIQAINSRIVEERTIGRDRQIGHSFLYKVKDLNDLKSMWKYEIFPLIEEYCYSDCKKVNKIIFCSDTDTQWITERNGILPIQDVGAMLNSIINNE